MLKRANITPEFMEFVDNQSVDVQYAAPRMKGDAPALTVLSIGDPDSAPEDRYYYSRRAGKDSVAGQRIPQARSGDSASCSPISTRTRKPLSSNISSYAITL